MRLLLDESVPVGVRDQLPSHEVRTVPEMGWAGLTNGALLAAAEKEGFDILITGDGNIVHQQPLAGRGIALIVLSSNHWPTIQANPDLVSNAVSAIGKGVYLEVTFPARRRRLRPGGPP